MFNKKYISLSFLVICNFIYCQQKPVKQSTLAPQIDSILQHAPTPPQQVPQTFSKMTFNLQGIEGLSKRQLDDHLKLYEGYVNKINEIHASLEVVDKSKVSAAYSPFRSLKVAETFAFNGMILHELYFENLSFGKKIGPQTHTMLIENFGSIANFKQNLMDCASCARGWAITAFSITDGKVYNFVLDAHNETVPILVFPLLVIDTYEHAYMIDFGVNRAGYLKLIWQHIDWDVVEERITKWVNKFHVYKKTSNTKNLN